MNVRSRSIESAIRHLVRDEIQKELAPLRDDVRALRQQLRSMAGRGAVAQAKKSAKGPWSGPAIRKLRAKLQVTQKELADLVGITPVAVYYWESGRTSPSEQSIAELDKLSKLDPRSVASRISSRAKRRRK